MFVCPVCKKSILDESTICAGCGLELTPEVMEKLKRKKRSFTVFLISFIALFGGLFAIGIISSILSSPQLEQAPVPITKIEKRRELIQEVVPPAESELTEGLSCYEIGYRYAICVGSALAGSTCPEEYDFVVPVRCRENPDMEKGISVGTKESMGNKLSIEHQTISKEDYIKSAKFIGTEEDDIFIKDFIKRPDHYSNQRIKINLKIMSIVEKEGNTIMNVYLTPNFEQGIVLYKGSVGVYAEDIITVFGEVIGTVEGTNGMGINMEWPGILAKYVELYKKGT